MTDRTFYKLELQGMVYLVDPITALAYTYDLQDPTEIGRVAWIDPKQKPHLILHDGWQTTIQKFKPADPPADP